MSVLKISEKFKNVVLPPYPPAKSNLVYLHMQIGSAVIKLLKGFGMKQPLVYDPFMDEKNAKKSGVRKVELNELMEHSDFITVHCPLNEQKTVVATAVCR